MNDGLDLPSDADAKVDQREHVRRGVYQTRAGIIAPLPAPGDRQGKAGDGVPAMTLHD